MLTPHPAAALEYWFFKVNAGPVALLVDWIARRRSGQQVLRASVHSPAGREVLFGAYAELTSGEQTLTMQRTRGRLGGIEWDLELTPGSDRIAPQIFPAAQLKLFDMTLLSAPLVEFTGWMRHGSQRFDLHRAPGMLSHYWGRGLPHEWWWVSATHLEPPGLAVEAMLLRSGLWGLPARVRLGYLYLRHEDRRRLWIAPPAAARISGSPESFTLEFRLPGGKPVRLVARGRDYGDFGEGIANTSVGDLEVHEGDRLLGSVQGAAGLERRDPGADR